MAGNEKIIIWEGMMKKFLALIVALSLTSASAQTHRGRRGQTSSRGRGATAQKTAPIPQTPLPVFLSRRGAATINEMMIQPPAFSYGSSINVWLLKDRTNKTREIAVTGHADSATCRRVSGQVMSLFMDKTKEPEDLFVAGAALLVDRGNENKREESLMKKSVQDFIKAEEELWAATEVLKIKMKSPAEGKEAKTAVEQAQEELIKAQLRVEALIADPEVQKYMLENDSAQAINDFVSQIRKFSRENGLVNIREIPLELVEQARARVTQMASSRQAQIVSFEELLKASEMPEAALFMPMLTVPGAHPVELRIPLASIRTANFAEAQRNNRNEVEQVIVGNAKDRLEVFKAKKAQNLRAQALCNRLSEEELRQPVVLPEVCTPEGFCFKSDKPETITREEYCKVRLPLNLKVVNLWIKHTNELLDRIEADAERKDGSRIEEFDYGTLVDSMLRDWRLPVPRSQVAFDTWRAVARGPVWRLLNTQLTRMGITPNVIGGEQMVFSVKVDRQMLVVHPIHVIDMARSVLVADPAVGATHIFDAWSMRSQSVALTTATDPSNHTRALVTDSLRLLAAGDRKGAEAQIAAAFSSDPATAFRSVEREWLQQFPDTRPRMLAIQESLKPVVEAIEWKEGLDSIVKADPLSKEGLREEVDAFRAFLESYPRVPVDLHLIFALKLAGYLADLQNDLNKRRQSPSPTLTEWDVLQAYVPREADNSIDLFGAPKLGPVNRQVLEKYLIGRGFKGRRLHRAVDDLLNIQAKISGSGDNTYLEARSRLSQALLADPAPLIRDALQVVMNREPTYWAAAVATQGLPKEGSLEWKAADEATKRVLSLFESDAQFLARLEDQLRKSYSGTTAADILSEGRKVDLSQSLSFINAAVGDGRTGSSPAFLAPQQTVKLFIDQQRAMDLLTRLQNASNLRSGSEQLLAIARARIEGREIPEAFRDAIPLRANLWFESGNYIKALDALIPMQVPIALYSPTLSWQTLPGDAVHKPVSVAARLEGSRVIFEATFAEQKKADVLVLDNLAPADAEALQKDFSENSEQMWSEVGKVSDQILLASVTLRPSLRELRDLLLSAKLRTLLVKSMVYGRNAPGRDLVQLSNGTASERVVALVDQVNGDGGRTFQIPSLNEVKQLAKTKVGQ
jgi:hypothetical protein